MAYTNAIFYMDLESGSDTARTALTSCTASNPSGTITRITKNAHGLVTGAVVTTSAFSAWLNGDFKITKVDDNNFDLDATVWQATADNSGTVTPFGGSSAADAWKTFTNGTTAARVAPGDVVRVKKSPEPSSIGNATWTDTSATVTLATAQTLTVDRCESAWTAANSSTVTHTAIATDGKEGSYCMKVQTANTTTSQLKAYFATGTLNLSSYQKLTFWVKNSAALASNNIWSICLCSDNAGTTVVDTFKIPALALTGEWTPVTITKEGGGNLGSAIESIALYSGSSSPANNSNLLLDNFEACTTSGLSLTSIIGKNSTAYSSNDECWYSPRSIVGTTIIFESKRNGASKDYPLGCRYYGTSETVTSYFINPIMISAEFGTINDSGTSGNLINYSGGWDFTSGLNDGITFVSQNTSRIQAVTVSSKNYISIDRFGFVGMSYGIDVTSCTFMTIGTLYSSCLNSTLLTVNTTWSNSTIDRLLGAGGDSISSISGDFGGSYNRIIAVGCISSGVQIGQNSTYQYILSCNNTTTPYGILFQSDRNKNIIKTAVFKNNGTGVYISALNYGNIIYDLTTSNTTGIACVSNASIIVKKAAMTDGTLVSVAGLSRATQGSSIGIVSLNTEDNNYVYTKDGDISSLTNTRVGGAGLMWKMNITGTDRSVNNPLKMTLAEIPVSSSGEVTVTCYCKKDHASNIASKIIVNGGYIEGVSSNVEDTKASDTNWEQLSISFTPTAKGVVTVEAHTWYVAGNSFAYFADLSVSQA